LPTVVPLGGPPGQLRSACPSLLRCCRMILRSPSAGGVSVASIVLSRARELAENGASLPVCARRSGWPSHTSGPHSARPHSSHLSRTTARSCCAQPRMNPASRKSTRPWPFCSCTRDSTGISICSIALRWIHYRIDRSASIGTNQNRRAEPRRGLRRRSSSGPSPEGVRTWTAPWRTNRALLVMRNSRFRGPY